MSATDNGHEPGGAPDRSGSVVVLYCGRCVAPDAGVPAGISIGGFAARLEMLPCSSKVEASHILKMLDNGAVGVEVVACPEEACRFLVGSLRAEKRIAYVRRLLEEIGVNAEKVGLSRGAGLTGGDLAGMAESRGRAARATARRGGKK